MPTYEYQCRNCGYHFEKFQSFKDAPITLCPNCGEEQVFRVVGATGVIFKGSGFYINDSKRGDSTARNAKSDGASGDGDKSESKSDGTSETKPAESTPKETKETAAPAKESPKESSKESTTAKDSAKQAT